MTTIENSAFQLKAISKIDKFATKFSCCPTEDLIAISKGLKHEELSYAINDVPAGSHVWFVYCKYTEDVWIAPTDECLNANFVYRDDLYIRKCESKDQIIKQYVNNGICDLDPSLEIRKSCYVLDNKIAETYFVYYNPYMPALMFGKSTPEGMTVRKFENRFQRDAFICSLDETYSESSLDSAKEFANRPLRSDEAIVVSDGCFRYDTSAASCWYLDADNVIHLTQAFTASDVTQSVVIAEIVGVYNALSICKSFGKKKVYCYYDNKVVMLARTSNKLKYIPEVRKYCQLLHELGQSYCKVEFVELHPKNVGARVEDNRALTYFHNLCDRDCREVANIFSQKYRLIAAKRKKTDGKGKQNYKQTNRK